MFSASEISAIIQPVEQTLHDPAAHIASLSIDSRQLTHGAGICFVALKGLRSDGHQYLHSAWEAGVRNFITDTRSSLPELPESNVFRVQQTAHALQMLAAAHRSKFSLPCIGVTGSNGKTWVKEWLYQLLSPEHFIVKSPRSFNSQIGVPLSVLQIRHDHTLGIFEAGISRRGEMQRLAEIVKPQIGILTHLGDAHQAAFDSLEEKLREKLRLFDSAESIVYCAEDPLVHRTITALYPQKRLLAWVAADQVQALEGTVAPEQLLITTLIDIRLASTGITYRYGGAEGVYEIPFTDRASIRNSITCCLVLLHLGYTPAIIAARMEGLYAIALRLAIHQLPGNSVLINDAYSLDLGSLSIALETLRQHSAGMSRTVILSDIDHQHAGSYRAMAALLAQQQIHHVLAIGTEITQMESELPDTVQFIAFPDVDTFVARKPWLALMPGAFLLKGARSFQFERLAEHMQGRYHSAILEIDLNVLLSNLQYFISQLYSGTRIIAMVKAAAYGSGGTEIARFLSFHNVAMLAVAYIDEGIELRNGGVETPILVMNPDPARVDQLYAKDLEPEVFDFAMLHTIAGYRHTAPLRIHIKVDTGMHRLGLRLGDLPELIVWLRAHPQIRVASVFTHLAASGDLRARDFTLGQVAEFNAFYMSLTEAIGYAPDRHVLNTAGVLYYPEFQYEAVRLGIGLYGAGLPEPIAGLQPVHTLKARISQIHQIGKGATVGYDRAFVAPSAMRIGTINIGYADGLRRCAGHQRYAVHVGGKPAMILGKVCMDMTMIDLSAHPDARPGDEVIIFGPHLKVDDLAQVCDTIPYEILTGISQRVARVLVYS